MSARESAGAVAGFALAIPLLFALVTVVPLSVAAVLLCSAVIPALLTATGHLAGRAVTA